MRPLVVSAYGAKVSIDIKDEALFDLVEQAVTLPGWRVAEWRDAAPCTITGERKGDRYVLAGGNIFHHNAASIEWTATVLMNALIFELAARSSGYLLARGGAVDLQGRRIGIIGTGPPSVGKSTLASALLDLGAGLVSERALVFDRQGALRPLPCPVCYQSSSMKTQRRVFPGLRPARAPLTDIVIVRYEELASGQLEISNRATVAAALHNSLFTKRAWSLDVWPEVVSNVECYTLVYGDPHAAAQQLTAALSGSQSLSA